MSFSKNHGYLFALRFKKNNEGSYVRRDLFCHLDKYGEVNLDFVSKLIFLLHLLHRHLRRPDWPRKRWRCSPSSGWDSGRWRFEGRTRCRGGRIGPLPTTGSDSICVKYVYANDFAWTQPIKKLTRIFLLLFYNHSYHLTFQNF